MSKIKERRTLAYTDAKGNTRLITCRYIDYDDIGDGEEIRVPCKSYKHGMKLASLFGWHSQYSGPGALFYRLHVTNKYIYFQIGRDC